MVVEENKKTFLERIEQNKNFPKKKISISVNAEHLKEFERLMKKHFPRIKLSPAFNEMLMDGLGELEEFDKGEDQ